MKADPVNILILDDDGTFRQYLKVRFGLENWNTHEVRSLHEARELMKETSFQVYLIDVYLHTESGLALVPEIRAQENKAHPPLIIAISGNIQEALVGESQFLSQYRVDDFFEKPFQVTDLIAKVRGLLAQQKDRSQAGKSETAPGLDPEGSFS